MIGWYWHPLPSAPSLPTVTLGRVTPPPSQLCTMGQAVLQGGHAYLFLEHPLLSSTYDPFPSMCWQGTLCIIFTHAGWGAHFPCRNHFSYSVHFPLYIPLHGGPCAEGRMTVNIKRGHDLGRQWLWPKEFKRWHVWKMYLFYVYATKFHAINSVWSENEFLFTFSACSE